MDLFKKLSILSIFLFLFSCSSDSDDDNPSTSQGLLVSSEYITFLSGNEARIAAEEFGLSSIKDSLKYRVNIYKMVYRTEFMGRTISASGLIYIPDLEQEMDIVSFYHGTIAADSEAPTNNISSSLASYKGLGFPAASGRIVLVPDFIGFGESVNEFHPYYVREPSARVCTDMIKAASEFLSSEGVKSSKRLFLTGYSQGGYMALATHRAIEQGALPTYDLVASYPSSGGYLIKGVQEFFFDQVTYDSPFFMGFVYDSYKRFYNWSQGYDLFFREPYATRMPSLYNRQLTGSQINDSLTTIIDSLIQPAALTGIDTDPQFSFVNSAFEENSLIDFNPQSEIHLFHGDADITVPYQNSVDSYQKFIDEGWDQNVTFTTLPGETHGSGFFPYFLEVVPDILSK